MMHIDLTAGRVEVVVLGREDFHSAFVPMTAGTPRLRPLLFPHRRAGRARGRHDDAMTQTDARQFCDFSADAPLARLLKSRPGGGTVVSRRASETADACSASADPRGCPKMPENVRSAQGREAGREAAARDFRGFPKISGPGESSPRRFPSHSGLSPSFSQVYRDPPPGESQLARRTSETGWAYVMMSAGR